MGTGTLHRPGARVVGSGGRLQHSMNSEERARARAKWRYVGRDRPSWATPPAAGKESVWDYPRPPRIERVPQRLRVESGGIALADTTHGQRVLETAGPPVYYFPARDVRRDLLFAESATSPCEWKGEATYFGFAVADQPVHRCAWSYRDPDPTYSALQGWFAFHAGRVDACFVGAELVTPQPGDYYGGWITSAIVGPFKGEPGSEDW